MIRTKTLLIAPVVFLSVFFVVPVANSILRYFRFSEFSNILGNQSLRGVAWFSLWQAAVSTLATLAVALPATWALSRFTFRGSRIARGILTAPFVLPAVVVAAGVLAITDSRGIIPILWAHVVFNVSVVVRIVGPRWSMVNNRLEHAAAALRARPSRTFTSVVWPQISDAVISAATLVFIYCFTSFGVIAILGGVSRRTLESEIFTQAVRLGNTSTATALAVLQAIIIGAVLLITRRSSRSLSTSLHVSAPQPLHTKPTHRATDVRSHSGSHRCISASSNDLQILRRKQPTFIFSMAFHFFWFIAVTVCLASISSRHITGVRHRCCVLLRATRLIGCNQFCTTFTVLSPAHFFRGNTWHRPYHYFQFLPIRMEIRTLVHSSHPRSHCSATCHSRIRTSCPGHPCIAS